MTNWPDPARPGVPINPERDGWHFLRVNNGTMKISLWRADGYWLDPPGYEGLTSPKTTAYWNAYLGPVLTPDEASALQAHVTELEGALDFYACVDHYQTHNAAAPNVVQFDRGTKARAALAGGKDE